MPSLHVRVHAPDDRTTRTDLLSSLDNDDPVARALFKMIDEKVHTYSTHSACCNAVTDTVHGSISTVPYKYYICQ